MKSEMKLRPENGMLVELHESSMKFTGHCMLYLRGNMKEKGTNIDTMSFYWVMGVSDIRWSVFFIPLPPSSSVRDILSVLCPLCSSI